MIGPYAIDACALIDACKAYNIKKKSFAHIWDKFDELFENGSIVSSIEIYDELKDNNLKEWIKKHKDKFLPLDKEIQEKTTEILDNYPTLIKIRSKRSSSNGDPFLIATAIIKSCIVITNERLGDENSKDYKLPNVCRKYSIDYISLNDFLDLILE